MSGRQTDTEVLAAQDARRRACAERGDLPGVARAVMDAACRNGSLTGPGAQAMDWLRGLPDGDRMELARIWARWHTDPEPEREGDIALRDVSYFRAELLVVASGVARGSTPPSSPTPAGRDSPGSRGVRPPGAPRVGARRRRDRGGAAARSRRARRLPAHRARPAR
ncbi:hypothetical protein ACFQ60_38530 [Streptomyces zhihengii]